MSNSQPCQGQRRISPSRPHTYSPGAEGSAVNVALPPGTGDAGWLRAYHAVVPAVVRAFQPQLLVSQCGADAHQRAASSS